MIKVNIYEATARLSDYVGLVEQGDTVVIRRNDCPVAEIGPLRKQEDNPRRRGLGTGFVDIRTLFFEPLPDDGATAFSGEPE
jgi:antitoxin (DNA-binding transcriptional repressor) of toxin-antitoxin stability system